MACPKEFIPTQEQDDVAPADYEKRDIKSFDFVPDDHVSRQNMCRKDILDFGDQGFLLQNMLTLEECQNVISCAEKIGFGEIKGSAVNYRSSTRILLDSPSLANHLWNHVNKYLTDIKIDGNPHDVHIHGITSAIQGEWKPQGLNQLFRLCRYSPGGHFAPHFDGHYVLNSEERSMQTLMLYLNGDFSGGSTNFVDEAQTLYMDESGKYCAEEKNIIHKIEPETGLAIIFNHHRLHEGEKLRDGTKYILRTDIMFTRCASPQVPRDHNNEKALQMLQEAERLEASGEGQRAVEMYRIAFKLSPELEEYFNHR